MLTNLSAYRKAAHDTAETMTAELRKKASEAGWHPDVVKGMHVEYGDNGYVVHIHEDHKDRAFVHEYGNETTRPTAVIRKFRNNPGSSNKAYMVHLAKHAEGTK